MKTVALYHKVRRAIMVDGMKRREAARYFGINRETVTKMLACELAWNNDPVNGVMCVQN
jgi:DNA-binding transcriptional regulator LsrR (DeoR family)